MTTYTGNQIYRRALALTDAMQSGPVSAGIVDANDALGRIAIRSLLKAGTVTMELDATGCAVYRLCDERDAPAAPETEVDLQ